MNESPIIASFDIATKTGLCWGRPGSKPQLASWNMRLAGTRPARFNLFYEYCIQFFAEEDIDQCWYEMPMGLGSMHKVGASEETIALLRGLVGVLELAAYRSDVRHIEAYTVTAARKHFTGKGTFRNSRSNPRAGKAAVMEVCRMLGVKFEDDDQADAYCGWSFACSLNNPRLAIEVTPLFLQTR
jgi:hypothetical protein